MLKHLMERGVTIPVLASANLPGAQAHNAAAAEANTLKQEFEAQGCAMGELDRLNFNSTLKPGELAQKNQGHVADRPVALFDDQRRFPGHFLFSFPAIAVSSGRERHQSRRK